MGPFLWINLLNITRGFRVLNSKIQHAEFTLGKSVLLLFLFQLSVGIAVVFVLYVLTDLVKLLPASTNDSHSGMVGTIVGSLCFGQWMEKRYPGMLDKKRIKKLSLWCTMINFILAILVFSALLYSDYTIGKPISWGGSGIAAALMLFVMVLMYFFTKYSIGRGVKSGQRRKAKLQ